MVKVKYSDRTLLELRKFSDALAALKEAAALEEDKIVRDSLLLRYVFTFEMAWQSMRQAMSDLGDRETPRLAFATLETAFKLAWITDPALWKDLRDARNSVVHAYDEAHAIALSAFVRSTAIPALDTLHDKLMRER